MNKLIVIPVLLLYMATSAQKKDKIIGTWEGKINVGVSLRIAFNFSKDTTGNITGVSYSPDQGNVKIPCTSVNVVQDSVFVGIKNLDVGFTGKFESDTLIKGKFIQGKNFDLTLSKVAKVSELPRPQTPHPPYSYLSEEVEYDNKDKSLHYGATITVPKGKGPFPAILLITGSGAQNRDEEIFDHKPFAVIADYLTKKGFVILRVDDRGTGKSTGDFITSTTADFVTDVNTGLNYLKERKEVDLKQVGLLGHSEGGMIATIIASQRNDIDFIILLAAPGEKISMLMEEQNVAILKSSGFTSEAANDYGKLYHAVIPAIINSTTTEEAKTKLVQVINDWKKNTPANIVTGTTGIFNDTTQQRFINAITETYSSPWFRYFLQFDPEPYLTRLHCKVLALNGDRDLQVFSKSNIAGLESALKKSKSPSFEVKEIPGVNHLFQQCKKCTMSEYGELQQTISPEVLDIISSWLTKNLK